MDKDGKRTSRIVAEQLVQPNAVLFLPPGRRAV
jgi:hypothetical protein